MIGFCGYKESTEGITLVRRRRGKAGEAEKRVERGLLTKLQQPKRKESICLHRNLYMNVHSGIIHNSQKVEKTHIFIN